MLPANLAKSRAAGARGLGELLMVSPHTGSGMLQTLRYSPYSVPVSTNTAMVAALAQQQQQPLVAAQQTAGGNLPAVQSCSPANVSPPPPSQHHYHQFDLNSMAAAAAAMNNSFSIPFADYYAAAVATTSAGAAAAAAGGQPHTIFPAISSLHQLTPHTTADSGVAAVTACRPTSEPFVPNLAELMFPKNSVLYA